MDPAICPYQKFVYRSLYGLSYFDATESFIYGFLSDKIVQIQRHSSEELSAPLQFQIIGTLVFKNLLFLVSPEALWFFDGSFHLIRKHNPHCTFFHVANSICILDSSETIIFDSETATFRTFGPACGEFGACSATATFEDTAYLGFESGKVVSAKLSDAKGLEVEDIYNINLVEPIISIAATCDYIFIAVPSAKIVRINKFKKPNEPGSTIFTQLNCPIRHLTAFNSFILGAVDSTLIIFNDKLKIRKFFSFMFEIMKLTVIENTLFVGFDAGLIVEYDLGFLEN